MCEESLTFQRNLLPPSSG